MTNVSFSASAVGYANPMAIHKEPLNRRENKIYSNSKSFGNIKKMCLREKRLGENPGLDKRGKASDSSLPHVAASREPQNITEKCAYNYNLGNVPA